MDDGGLINKNAGVAATPEPADSLPERMKADQALAGRTCPRCWQPIVLAEDVWNCPICQFTEHLRCFQAEPRCANRGCATHKGRPAAAPAPAKPKAKPKRGKSNALVWLGLIALALIPPVAVIVAVILIVLRKEKGWALLALAVLGAVLWWRVGTKRFPGSWLDFGKANGAVSGFSLEYPADRPRAVIVARLRD